MVNVTSILGNNERLTVRNGITAPIGDPAVLIEGNNARLTVTRDGSIAANDPGNTAVQVNGDDARVSNSGFISGALNGISNEGDNFSLSNFGIITSASRAVDLSDGDGLRVTNSGRILGTGNQRNGTLYVDGTVDDLRLNNTRSGVIDAGVGNLGDGISVQVGATGDDSNEDIRINNSGLIRGRGDGPNVFANGGRVGANGSSGLRFFNGSGLPEATVTGSVTNSGTITAEVNVGFLGGLVVEDGVAFEGRITNRRGGLISGPRNGLYIGNAQHDLDIRNEGRIESGSRAVNIDGSGVRLRNSGHIVGTGDQRDGTIYTDATATNYSIFNERSGVIDAGIGNQGTGISLQIGDVDGDVVTGFLRNDGLIQGRGNAINSNLEGDGIRLASGVPGGSVTLVANIDNRGQIVSTDDGIDLREGVTLAGDINNQGTIAAGDDGIIINGIVLGDINNSGNLSAADEGIEITNDGVVGDINNQGVITAQDDGIEIDGVTGDINNRGRITSVTQNGISLDSPGTVDGDINNFGTISAQDANNNGQAAIEIDGLLTGSINNFGLIENQRGGVAIDVTGANAGVTINNQGVINGDVELSNFDDVFNSAGGVVTGTIEGQDGNDLLIGGLTNDILVGGSGNDTLTGGEGADTFVFSSFDLGADVITDFQNGLDLIDVSAFNFGAAALQNVINNAQQIGGNVLLTFAPNNSVLLEGIQTNILDTTDFVVV